MNKMTEIKTLKEIDEAFLQKKGYNILCPEAFKLIRKEVIKWYNHLEMTGEDDVFDFLETFFDINKEDYKKCWKI